MFYNEAQGVVFIIDGSDATRLKIVKDLIEFCEFLNNA